jgi:RNA polymerase sigma-70 factor (ECF subfamily)
VSEDSERQLLEQARMGDPNAFSILVERYSARLFGACFSFLGNRQDAEDCVQEAFIKAYRCLAEYSFLSTFYTWLYRIAINTCLDYRRKYLKRQHFSLDEALEMDDSQVFQQIADRGPLPDEQAETAETVRLIRQEIARLPDYLKDILILRDLEGLSYHELAALLQLSEGTVKSRLSRARQQLMKMIRQREQTGDMARLTDKP